MKKALKISLICLLSIVVLSAIAASIFLNIVMTPEKVTPIVNRVVTENFDDNCKIGSVDISLFSTFPYLSIAIDSVVVAENDSVKVASIESLAVNFNPFAYLFEDRIEVEELSLVRPHIVISTDADSVSNCQFLLDMIPSDSVESVDTTQFRLTNLAKGIDINKISLVDAYMEYSDRVSDLDFISKGVSMSLGGKLLEPLSNLNFNFSCEDINAKHQGRQMLEDFMIDISSEILLDRDSSIMTIVKSDIGLRNITLANSGRIRFDSVQKGMDLDLDFSLAVGSLENIVSKMAKSPMLKNQNFDVSGSMALDGNINGFYSRTSLPNVDGVFTLSDGKLKFDGMKYGVDLMNIEANLKVDGNKLNNSSVEIKQFKVASDAGVDVDARAMLTDLMGRCNIDFKIVSNINMSKISQILPFSNAVEANGVTTTNLSGKVKLDDILKLNYGAMFLDGNSQFKDLLVIVDGNKLIDSTYHNTYLYLQMDNGSMSFGSKTKNLAAIADDATLSANVNFSGIGFKNKNGMEVNFANVDLSAKSKIVKDTTQIIPVEGELKLEKFVVSMTDTLSSLVSSSVASFSIVPSPEDKSKAEIKAALRADSIDAYIVPTKAEASLSAATFDLFITADSTRNSNFKMDANVDFEGFKLFSQLFPLDITLNKTGVAYSDTRLRLNRTRINIGKSDIVATGWVENALGHLMKKNDLNIISNLSISSNYLDIGEMYMASMLASADSEEKKEEIASELESNPEAIMHSLKLPEGLETALNLDVNKLKFGDIEIDSITGDMSVHERSVDLNSLKFNTVGSQMNVTASYVPQSDSLAHSLIDFKANRIILKELVAIIPAIDTLMPTLKSIEGNVNFTMVAKAEINNRLEIELPSLESVMSFDGQDLVLLDGETFAEVSKSLKFKNRDRNVIDTLGLNVIVRKGGNVLVPPFELEMDRYRAIIGGRQTVDFKTFDINYAYNISVIKSPVLIKLGLDITGTNDNFDFKVTKAKLKHSDFGDIQTNVDSLRNVLLKSVSIDEN